MAWRWLYIWYKILLIYINVKDGIFIPILKYLLKYLVFQERVSGPKLYNLFLCNQNTMETFSCILNSWNLLILRPIFYRYSLVTQIIQIVLYCIASHRIILYCHCIIHNFCRTPLKNTVKSVCWINYYYYYYFIYLLFLITRMQKKAV